MITYTNLIYPRYHQNACIIFCQLFEPFVYHIEVAQSNWHVCNYTLIARFVLCLTSPLHLRGIFLWNTIIYKIDISNQPH